YSERKEPICNSHLRLRPPLAPALLQVRRRRRPRSDPGPVPVAAEPDLFRLVLPAVDRLPSGYPNWLYGSRIRSGRADSILRPYVLQAVRRIRERIRLRKFLPLGEADCAGKSQLLFCELIFNRNQTLLLSLQLYLRPQNINTGNQTAVLQISGTVVNCLSCPQLGACSVYAAGFSDGIQVKIRCDQRNQFPDILQGIITGRNSFRSRPQLMS